MSPWNRLAPWVLFWAMTLLGGGSLAASLVLPAWLEYRQSQHALHEVRQRIARLEYQIRCAQARLRHLRDDPSYIARLAREEFGTPVPGVRTVFVYDPPRQPDPRTATSAAPESPTARSAETFARSLESRIRRNPWLAVFVLPPTRPSVMLLATGLLVSAWILFPAGRRS